MAITSQTAAFGFLFLIGLTPVAVTPAGAFDKNRAYEHVNHIAGDEFEGRKSGLTGGVMIEEYVASQFESCGLQPAGVDGTYFQKFPFLVTEEKRAELELVDGPFAPVKFVLADDFTLITNSGSADITAEVVLVGHGLVSEEWGRDDYGDLDVTGKIVMIVRGSPDDGYDWSEYSSRDSTLKIALNRGAAGILWLRKSAVLAGAAIHTGVYDDEIPMAYIGERVAHHILRDTGYDLARYRKELKDGPVPLTTGRHLRFHAEVSLIPEGSARNVLGLIPGSDPVLSSEVIVVGGHMDHVGVDGNGRIYNGANDNGSGTGVVLELARSFASSSNRPKRSILFMMFAAEEQGLLGSEYFAENPTMELADVAAMFNLDMVGHGDEGAGIGGGENFPGLWEAYLESLSDDSRDSLDIGRAWGGSSSDHAPFREKGVPVVSFWSKGTHRFYHLFEDDGNWISADALGSVGSRAESFVGFLANWDEPLLVENRLGRTRLNGALQIDFDKTVDKDAKRYQAGSVLWCEAKRFGKDRFALDIAEIDSDGADDPTAPGLVNSLKEVPGLAGKGKRAILVGIEAKNLEDFAEDRIPLLNRFGVALARWPRFEPSKGDSARLAEELEFFGKITGEEVALLVPADTAWIPLLPEGGKIYVRFFPTRGETIKDPELYPVKTSLFIMSLDERVDPAEIASIVRELGSWRVHIDLMPWINDDGEKDVVRFIEELEDQDGMTPALIQKLLGSNLFRI